MAGYDPYAMLDASIAMLNGALGYASNASTNKANLAMTKDTNAANLAIAQQTNAMNSAINERNISFQAIENAIAREREDNAVRRRAMDLVGAGLSKTLAAGSPAAANAMQAPQATIGMQTGHAMQSAKFQAFRPDISTDFSTAMARQKQLDIADKEADAAMLNAQTQRDRAKAESEHWINQDDETRRHNEVTEAANARYTDLQDQWKKAELDQNSHFHEDAMDLNRAELALKEVDYLNKWDQMEIQNEYYKAQTEFEKTTTSQLAARLTADLAESAARVNMYIAEANLSVEQLDQVKANVKEIAARISYIVAEKNNLNAATRQILTNTLTSIYNLSVAKAQHTTTTSPVPSDATAAENAKARHADLAGRIIGGVTNIFSVGLGAFIGSGAGRFISYKMFGEEHRPMGFGTHR